MSGFAFQPVQTPDFGATLARSQQFGMNQLLALAQMRQMQEAQDKEAAYTQYGGDLASADPAARTRAAAALLRFNPQAFMEMLQSERDRNWDAPAGGDAAPAAMPAAMPAGQNGDASMPRGLRNNNPLNIEAGGFTQGLPGFQGSDGRFARFASLDQGLAAADKLLESYGQRGLTTPLAIISRWAPAGDGNNNPQAYATTVARRLGVQPDTQLNMSDPQVRRQLATAMAEVENGRPLPGGGGNVVPVSGSGLPAVPGFDMARVERARRAAAGGNPYALREWNMYVQAAGLMAKDTAVERVRQPDGSEVFVPRSQVAGMRSAPEPRPAAGNDAPGQAGETLRKLGPRVRDGSASPDEVEQWRQAYDAYTQERIDPTTNSRIPGRPETPQMRAAREALLRREAPDAVPAPGQPNAAPQLPAPGASVPIGNTGMVAEPPGGQGAQPRVETTASGSTRTVTPPRITPQAQEAARKLEVDAAGLSSAVQQFREAMRLYGAGRTGLQAFNPRSEEGARLNQAFENMKMALRGEAFANTGVLQPGENRMIDEILRNPRSLTGLLSSVDASNAQLDELLTYAEAKVNAARRAADLPPLTLRPQGGGAGNQQRPPLSSFQR